MSIRRQCYEWRNVVQNIGDTVYLNGYPTSWVGSCITTTVPANEEIDIFIGGIGNNIDMPARLKAYQYVVIDAVAVFPVYFNAQIYVNTTKYFQDPDGVPSRDGGISGFVVPFPNRATWTQGGNQSILNLDCKKDFNLLNYQTESRMGVTIKTSQQLDGQSEATGDRIAKCFVKYLLIDGADAVVARRLAMQLY